MAKPELGTKRVDPETGKKFYDLNRDPIVSPYTGLSYPRSYFEVAAAEVSNEEEVDTEELDTALEKSAFMLLEEDVDVSKDDEIPDLDDDDVDLVDDDTFLSHDEGDEDDDVTDILGNGVSNDDDV
ncbi:TIGR02300 family protein [Bartonella sp. CDC_skunk]|uniref:TIGR02300 family protein n=1 Tax=Bartonella rochalimae ATCC BAA-1498 TaxID=685782 RepID=E6YJX5_9HYPH|nr:MULTISPECIES: TIGR02300 family protein [Bartonella]AQX19124.1 TIGR02300 family protein [Bartonella sp. A1379B]AQX20756.1 TIGR02300 family protein [Bartonella sp. CDC_skunk]AQX22348.1 TIGR02300 family protein [Bartonella sp. 11B]AQX24369.1 TIGR02300 family protein [Bartonella sp. 114]AQX24795.1 TIGR02300 family protein [Bartonella sp. Coyote22sub2]